MGIDLSNGAGPPAVPERNQGLLQDLLDAATGVAGALAEGLNGVIGLIGQALFGNYTGDNSALLDIRDGQHELEHRVDLLGESAYCSAYMTNAYRLGPGRNRALPFDHQIGPPQDAEIVQVSRSHPGVSGGPRDEWCIRLDREGLWKAEFHFSHRNSHGVFTGYSYCWAEVHILDPNLQPYSFARFNQGAGSGNNDPHDIQGFRYFVTPEPGYYVQVRWFYRSNAAMRRVFGGAARSAFTVVQWSDQTDDNSSDDEAGEIGEGDDEDGGDDG